MVDSSKARFSNFAQRYVASDTHAKGEELTQLLQIGEPQDNWLTLDIATGGGHTARTFAPFVRRVVASDLTYNMLIAARRHVHKSHLGNIEFCGAQAEWLSFKNETFDLVTCRIAPHHFMDVAMFVSECYRVLKPGGGFLLQDHALPEDKTAAGEIDVFERLRDPSHNRAYSKNEWMRLFDTAGFLIEHYELIVKEHHFQSWAERQDCIPETMRELERMVAQMVPEARAWMQPSGFPGPQATFVNQHILILGRKP